MINYDLIVIGGGPSGLAAAIEAKKSGIDSILLIERDRELGGILNQCIHNGFGIFEFNEELTGPEYAERFINELHDLEIEYRLNTMVLDITEDKIVFMVNKEEGYKKIKAKSIILSMGCREKTRGAIRLPGDRPAGIMTAGTAQRYINMEGYMVGKKVYILGSGDIGLIMARRLVLEGAEVLGVLVRGNYASGLTRNVVQCLEDYDIPLMLNHTIKRINGKERLESIEIVETDKNKNSIEGTEVIKECDTLLLSVGLIPENELSKSAGVKLFDKTGGPEVNELMETNIEGIFACGNVLHVHDLVDYVSEESKRAGKNAARYIKGDTFDISESIETISKNGISYIIPNEIRIKNLEENLNLYFRVCDVYENVYILVKFNDTVIKKVKKRFLTPGEMENIKINIDQLNNNHKGELTIEIEN